MNKRIIIFIVGLVPILMVPFTGFTWLIFSLYCFAVYFRKLPVIFRGIPLSPRLKFFMFFFGFGMLTEVFAIVDNLPKPPVDRILFSANPWFDLYFAVGYYSAFAMIWSVAYFHFNFTHQDVFLIAGAFGILFEQTGKILLSFNFFAYLYVFLVYGSYPAIAAFLSSERRGRMKSMKKVVVGTVVEILSFLLADLFLHILSIFVQ